MRPYVIVAPSYRNNSAGVRCLHYLCSLLNNVGQTAYITGQSTSEFNVKYVSSLSKEECRVLQQEGIVVYPDIINGNPLKFRNVVRWDLAPQRFEYLPTDVVFVFNKLAAKTREGRPELFLTHIERFFNPYKEYPRTKRCYWIGKSKRKPAIPELHQCIQIRYDWPPTRTELAELFQRSQVFYNFDEFSGLTVESRLCGCPTIIIPEGNFSKDDIRLCEFGTAGLFFYDELTGQEDLFKDIHTVRELLDFHKQVTEVEQLTNFVKITQEMNSTYTENIKPIDVNHRTWLCLEKFI